jgi:hypothetical protein
MKNRNIIITTILLALGSLALPQRTQAVSPAPDGFYPGLNTAEGQNALFSLTTGTANTAVGWFSLKSNAEGSFNTATGAGALLVNTADNNTAFGAVALFFNTIGTANTAVGAAALFNDTTGGDNTATGTDALYSNTDASFNTATGFQALKNNTAGNNTATGADALIFNTTGVGNTAHGNNALRNNIDGTLNTANGVQGLLNNTHGTLNTSTGAATLITNTTGSSNTADGVNALFSTNGDNNTAVGKGALGASTTGNNNTALGFGAGSGVTAASNVICIGANVAGNDVDNSCYIGNIFGDTSSGGTAVFVNTNGRLGTTTSSRRFKDSIKPMDQASEALFALKPVAFRYKKEIDPAGTSQFGLVAEDVEAVNPDLVVRDKDGKAYSVRYEQVNAMLLNEFLKAHRKIQEQEATMTQLRKEMETVVAHSKEQDSKIQKVSDQIEINKPRPGVVSNDP